MEKKDPLMRNPECIFSLGTRCDITDFFLCRGGRKCSLCVTHEEYAESCRKANERLRSLPEEEQIAIAAVYHKDKRVWEENK